MNFLRCDVLRSACDRSQVADVGQGPANTAPPHLLVGKLGPHNCKIKNEMMGGCNDPEGANSDHLGGGALCRWSGVGGGGHGLGLSADAERQRRARQREAAHGTGQQEAVHGGSDRRRLQSAGLVSRRTCADAGAGRDRTAATVPGLRALPSADRRWTSGICELGRASGAVSHPRDGGIQERQSHGAARRNHDRNRQSNDR